MSRAPFSQFTYASFMMLTFPIPEGFEMPPDAEVGGEFEIVARVKDNEDGTLTITAIDGAEIEMEEEESGGMRGGKKVEIEIETEEDPGPGGFKKRAMERGLMRKPGMRY